MVLERHRQWKRAFEGLLPNADHLRGNGKVHHGRNTRKPHPMTEVRSEKGHFAYSTALHLGTEKTMALQDMGALPEGQSDPDEVPDSIEDQIRGAVLPLKLTAKHVANLQELMESKREESEIPAGAKARLALIVNNLRPSALEL